MESERNVKPKDDVRATGRHRWALVAMALSACSSASIIEGEDTVNAVSTVDTVDVGNPALDTATDTTIEPDAPPAPPIDAQPDATIEPIQADTTGDTTPPLDIGTLDSASSPEDVGPVDIEESSDAESGQCQSYGSPQVTGTLPPTITEASGMAISQTQPGVLWVHNDSGDQARIYAIKESGERLATVTLAGTYAYDWEDMAEGPCSPTSPQSCLYVGDIGDNSKTRTYIKVHRVPEPDVTLGDHTISVDDYDTMTVVYPDGSRDCEALVVDGNGFVYLLSKEWGEPIFRLYGTPFLPGAELVPLQFLSEHDISEVGGTVALVTAASYSPTLNQLLVRTYGAAFTYQLGPEETLSELPWVTPQNVPVANEGQGEAIAHGELDYWHVSEGKEPPIWRIPCE